MAQATSSTPQPKHEAAAKDKGPDLTTGSPAAVANAKNASAVPTVDVVQQVSRDVNGDPAQSRNFRVMVDDDAPEHVKHHAWNKDGEALGAKHGEVRAEEEELDHDARAKTEREELRRINRGD